MALTINDRVKETSTTTGTGALTFAGAVSGFETFSAGIGNSNTTYYAVVNTDTPTEWEVGLGTLAGDSSTITRTTVISSSNSDSAVDFGSGTKEIFCTLPASKAVIKDASGDVTFGDNDITNVGDIALDSISNDGTDITLDSSGDIVLDADGTQIYLKDAGTLFGSLTNSSGELVIKSSSSDTTALTFSGANATLAGTLGVGAITGTSTIQGTTITATTAFVPDASDGAALGTTALEFSDLYLADGAVVGFGDDQDVTLTHVADTGLLLNSTMALQFNDSSQYINAPSNAILDINATDEIELNATLADINANLDVSGTIVGASTISAGTAFVPDADDGAALGTASLNFADAYFADGAVINFGDDQDVSLTHVADTGLTLSSTDKLMFNDASQFVQGSSATVLSLGATDEIDLTATAIDINGTCDISGTFSLAGTDITTTAAEINLIDGGTARGTTAVASGDGLLVNDGGTMAMTNVDTVSTYFASHSVGGGNIVTTGALDSGSITSGFGAIDNGTSGIRTATFTAETAFVPDASDGAALGTTALEFSDLFLADGAVINFGDDQDVTLTHVADTGLLLNSTMQLQFNDASQNINAPSATVLDINATDEIELNATLVDINANVEISGTATTTGVHTFTAVPVFPNNTIETADIQDDAITSAKIADSNITNALMADNSIDSAEYVDGSIDTAHIADDQVTLAKMAGLARGKLIYGNSSGNPTALAVGSADQVLTADGTDFAWADSGGGGKVLQVVSGTNDTETDTSGTSFVTSNTSVNITPAASSSKILVFYSMTCRYHNSASPGPETARTTVYRDSTNLNSNGYSTLGYMTAGNQRVNTANNNILDSPSTSSQVTYTVYGKTGAGSNETTLHMNYDARSTITAIEIGA